MLTPADLTTTNTTIPALDSTDPYPYDPTIPPMPPSPTAEPFIPDATDTNQQGSALSTEATADRAAFPLSAAERGQGVRSTTLTTPLTTLQHQRTLAIERHRARSAAAWALHDQLRATLDPFLARLSERLLLHTQDPDDTDHVSMSTLELAGGPLSPAFRAMYHMLPGLITGLTRSLALAERADLQIDRLLAIVPPAPTQSPAPKAAPTPPTQQAPVKLQPTSEEFRRAAHAARIAEEDAYVILRLTQHQRDLICLYCALPDPLPDGPMETWNITVDPNAPLTRWREVLLPHKHRLDDLDDDPDPTPPSGKGGHHSGNNSGNNSGNASGNATGNKISNASGNDSHTPTPPPSPHDPFPPREGGRGLGKIGNATHSTGNISGNDSGNKNTTISCDG